MVSVQNKKGGVEPSLMNQQMKDWKETAEAGAAAEESSNKQDKYIR